jgi:hypothetical protein
MSFGKNNTTTTTAPTLTPEQRAAINAQTGFLTGTIIPTYQNAVTGATNVYNQNLPGVTGAAQNLGTVAGQAQNVAGSTGESALRTGISGLENLFGNDYVQQQLQAALMPAQAQYMQNVAGQSMGFGGAGQIGSARQALAGQQLAGQTQAMQQQAAAGVMRDIASQRAQVGQALAQLGQSGLGQAVNYAGQGVTASQVPQDVYNKYASVIFGTPQGSYLPNFAGTQGSTANQSGSNWGIKI